MAGEQFNDQLRYLHLQQLNNDNLLSEGRLRHRLTDPDEETRQAQYLIQLSSNRVPIRDDPEDIAVKKYIGSGVAFISLVAENLLSHPFIVLRRQCQVNHTSTKYHIVPFTLLPAVLNLHSRQGLTTLWKGLGSALFVRGMILGIEDLISKATPWPKEITAHSSLKQFFQHTLLKCVSFAIVTPFYSASFVETVQSEIASESPGCLDVFREGFMRLLNWGAPSRGRMLPIWALIVPTVTLGVAKYLFNMMIKGASGKLLHARFRNRHEVQGALPKDLAQVPTKKDIDLTSSIIAAISTDVMFYPCETILHRLHLQGTIALIDNLDNGLDLFQSLTQYEGFFGAIDSMIFDEGFLSFYKGFGALILEYTIRISLVYLIDLILYKNEDLLFRLINGRTRVKSDPPRVSLSIDSDNESTEDSDQTISID